MAHKLQTPQRSSSGQAITHVAMIASETREIDEDKHRVLATMSSQTEDREGDEIKVDGWVLDNFRKHPVMLSSHDYGGGFLGAGAGLTRQIGRWDDVGPDGDDLTGWGGYMTGLGNPEADWGFELAKANMAAYSVGFMALEKPEEIKDDKGRRKGYRFIAHELLECSHVIIPAHPDALQRALMKGSTPGHPAMMELLGKLESNAVEFDLAEDWRAVTLRDHNDLPLLYGVKTEKGISWELPTGEIVGDGFTVEERRLMVDAAAGFLRHMHDNPKKFASGKPAVSGGDRDEDETTSEEATDDDVNAWFDQRRQATQEA